MPQTQLKSQQAFGGDGWQLANETWTYASASTITVPSGAASRYQKGDKIRFQNNDSGTYLHAYILTVADTLLTVVGDSVPNATLTDNYYSHAENPLGFPDYFSFATTASGFSSVTSALFYYKIICGTLFFTIYLNGTSNATTMSCTLPKSSVNIANLEWTGATGYTVDNGSEVTTPSKWTITALSSSITFTKTMVSGGGGFTNSGGKQVRCQGFYNIS